MKSFQTLSLLEDLLNEIVIINAPDRLKITLQMLIIILENTRYH